MRDTHLLSRPDAMLLDQDDDVLLLGVKVSKSWLQTQSPAFHDLMLAMLAQMTVPNGQ